MEPGSGSSSFFSYEDSKEEFEETVSEMRPEVGSDDQLGGVMLFPRSHFLGRSNLPISDTAPDVAAMTVGELRESVRSHRTQMDIAVSI